MRRRIPEIDGIRGCAILLVVVHHYVADQILAPESGSAGAAVLASVRLSWSGVDLFFVLSGFLIARVLLRNRDATNYFRVFYTRRACRILPAYVVLLGTYYAALMTPLAAVPTLGWLFSNPMPDYSYLTFTQNIFMGMRESFGAAWLIPTWSLAVEEQFYLVVPALALLAPRKFTRVALAAMLAAPLLRFLFPGFHTYLLSPFRADSLAAGVLLAIVLENQAARAWVMERRESFTRVLVGMLGLTALVTFFPWLGPLEYTWLAGLYAVLLLLALTAPASAVAGVMRWTPLRWIGVRSYGLYLFHLPVLGLIQGFRGHSMPEITGIGDIGATLLALAVSLLIAALSFRYIERPFIELGQKSRHRVDAPDGAARSAQAA